MLRRIDWKLKWTLFIEDNFLDSWLNEYVADIPHYYHKETEVSVLGIDKQY